MTTLQSLPTEALSYIFRHLDFDDISRFRESGCFPEDGDGTVMADWIAERVGLDNLLMASILNGPCVDPLVKHGNRADIGPEAALAAVSRTAVIINDRNGCVVKDAEYFEQSLRHSIFMAFVFGRTDVLECLLRRCGDGGMSDIIEECSLQQLHAMQKKVIALSATGRIELVRRGIRFVNEKLLPSSCENASFVPREASTDLVNHLLCFSTFNGNEDPGYIDMLLESGADPLYRRGAPIINAVSVGVPDPDLFVRLIEHVRSSALPAFHPTADTLDTHDTVRDAVTKAFFNSINNASTVNCPQKQHVVSTKVVTTLVHLYDDLIHAESMERAMSTIVRRVSDVATFEIGRLFETLVEKWHAKAKTSTADRCERFTRLLVRSLGQIFVDARRTDVRWMCLFAMDTLFSTCRSLHVHADLFVPWRGWWGATSDVCDEGTEEWILCTIFRSFCFCDEEAETKGVASTLIEGVREAFEREVRELADLVLRDEEATSSSEMLYDNTGIQLFVEIQRLRGTSSRRTNKAAASAIAHRCESLKRILHIDDVIKNPVAARVIERRSVGDGFLRLPNDKWFSMFRCVCESVHGDYHWARSPDEKKRYDVFAPAFCAFVFYVQAVRHHERVKRITMGEASRAIKKWRTIVRLPATRATLANWVFRRRQRDLNYKHWKACIEALYKSDASFIENRYTPPYLQSTSNRCVWDTLFADDEYDPATVETPQVTASFVHQYMLLSLFTSSGGYRCNGDMSSASDVQRELELERVPRPIDKHMRRAEFVAACCLRMVGVCEYLVESSSRVKPFRVRLPLPSPPSSTFDSIMFHKRTVMMTGLSRDEVIRMVRRAMRRRRLREGEEVLFSVWLDMLYAEVYGRRMFLVRNSDTITSLVSEMEKNAQGQGTTVMTCD